MEESEIVNRIRTLYPNATIDVDGEECSFTVFVVDEGFAGMNTLQRQRPLLALFQEDLGAGRIHALTIKAKTSAELQQQDGLVQIKL